MKTCFWSTRGVFLTVFATWEEAFRELIPKTTPRNGSETSMSQLKYISFTNAQVDQKETVDQYFGNGSEKRILR